MSPTPTMETTTVEPTQIDTKRSASTRWVPIREMHVTPSAQRKYERTHAQRMADDFDLEALGYPVVNYRDGKWWIVDGQHRIGALKIMGWEDQQIECECYVGMTEEQEADLFLRRDARKAVHPLDKFRIAVNAGRGVECEIQKIADDLGLTIGFGPHRVGAVGTLRKIYDTAGPSGLGRTLLIIREAFGETGFSASMLAGVAAVILRYGNNVDTNRLVRSLRSVSAGAAGIEQGAAVLVRSTGNSKAVCVGAEIVKYYNRSKGKKLTNWWKDSGADAA